MDFLKLRSGWNRTSTLRLFCYPQLILRWWCYVLWGQNSGCQIEWGMFQPLVKLPSFAPILDDRRVLLCFCCHSKIWCKAGKGPAECLQLNYVSSVIDCRTLNNSAVSLVFTCSQCTTIWHIGHFNQVELMRQLKGSIRMHTSLNIVRVESDQQRLHGRSW